MIAIPQFLDFPDDGQTSEICEFFLKMLQHKNKALYMHSQQVANYAASIAAVGLPLTVVQDKPRSIAARYRQSFRAQHDPYESPLPEHPRNVYLQTALPGWRKHA